jgi:ubiquinone/menaquinone biosynthesis C-methylase UbiE
VNELAERVAREKAAYDGGTVHRESSELQARFHHVFECPNSQRGERYLDEVVEKYAKNKDILDYGCYDGWMVPRYQKMRPSSITGLDISETAISKAQANYGDRAKFYAGDAHAMPFTDESFDLVVGRAILHHLELDLALKEIRRVLRPAGKAIFVEPLGDNPGAKLLRAITPKARTKDEKPLTRSVIQRADVFFGGSSHLFLNLVSVPVAMLTSLTPLSAHSILLRSADRVDQLLARTALKYWMRQVVLVWHRS